VLFLTKIEYDLFYYPSQEKKDLTFSIQIDEHNYRITHKEVLTPRGVYFRDTLAAS